MKDLDTLYYPGQIEEEIGLHRHQINAFKNQGCPFLGQKTTIRWVREHIARITGAAALTERRAGRPRRGANKSDAQVLNCDSQASSPPARLGRSYGTG